jgi:hypothetical protein
MDELTHFYGKYKTIDMKLKLSNYKKKSDPKWHLIGDICLYSIPLYIAILTPLPLGDNLKLWLIGVLSFVLTTVKIITKYTVDPNFVQNETTESTS